MKKVLRNHFYYEIVLFLALLYSITFSVHLNGDDFMYGTFAREGILNSVWGYYHTGNGRFWINIIDSWLLFFDRHLYALITPLLVLAFIVLLAENVQLAMSMERDKKREQRLIRVGMALFASVDVLCLRETVFWITGMMNYLFPAVVMLYASFLFQKNRCSPYKCVWYYIVCFFAASSVEQYALMFVGLMTLYHFFDIIDHRVIAKRQYLAFAIALVGLAFLLLAPGNFERVEEQQMPSFISNTWSLVYQNTMHLVALPFMVMLSMLSTSLQPKESAQKFMYVAPFVFCSVACIPVMQNALVYACLIAVFVVQFSHGFCKMSRADKKTVAIWSIIGLGSQIMLLISAVWGFRCMYSMYLVYMFIIMMLVCNHENALQHDVLSCGLLASIHPFAAMGYMMIKTFFGKSSWWCKTRRAIVPVCAIVSLLIISHGYRGNIYTLNANEDNTKKKQEVIYLNELPKKEYAWYSIPMNDFHEDYYKRYYEIEDKEITYLYIE